MRVIMSRLIARWTGRILLGFLISTILLMLYADRSHDEQQLRSAIQRKKHELSESIRLRKLRDLQKTLFIDPKRPDNYPYNINISIAEMTPLERDVPDSRPMQCKSITYDYNQLPKLSVIIPFYNEALSMLLRTVHSILQRTPDSLLQEIILVNDHSPNEDLGEPLEKYIKFLPKKVKLVKMEKREGLIRARLTGARMAKGPVIMFQDAHTENNHGWAEPLLEEIRKNPKTIIQPYVEQVTAETIEYVAASDTVPRGGFSWDLRYTWMEMPEHEKARRGDKKWLPFRTPTLVGCALAVDKQHFFDIGAFDDNMNIWGGENIELAWRNWMCHGQVLGHPCSRVAHVFKPFSYKFDGDREKIVQKNLMRIAELWMGDWKKYFYAATYSWPFKRTFFTERDKETLALRQAIKEKFQCKDFDWYMKTIVPEYMRPQDDAVYYGEVFNLRSEACWFMSEDGYVAITYFCFFHRTLPQNNFLIDKDGRLRYHDNSCLRVELSTLLIKRGPCVENPEEEKWDVVHKSENTGVTQVHILINNERRTFCVLQVTNVNKVHHKEQMPQLTDCNFTDEFQLWRWTYKFDWNYNWDPPQI